MSNVILGMIMHNSSSIACYSDSYLAVIMNRNNSQELQYFDFGISEKMSRRQHKHLRTYNLLYLSSCVWDQVTVSHFLFYFNNIVSCVLYSFPLPLKDYLWVLSAVLPPLACTLVILWIYYLNLPLAPVASCLLVICPCHMFSLFVCRFGFPFDSRYFLHCFS